MPENCGSVSNATCYVVQDADDEYVTGTNHYGDAAYAQAIAFNNSYKVVGLYAIMGQTNAGYMNNAAKYVRLYDGNMQNILASTTYTPDQISNDDYTEFRFSQPVTTQGFWAAIEVGTYTDATKNSAPWIVIYSTEDGCTPGDYLISYSVTDEAGNYGWVSVKEAWSFSTGITLYLYPILDVEDSGNDNQGTTGLSEVELNKISSVYPNPAQNNVVLASGVELQKVEIFNTLGQVVYSEKANGNHVSVNTSDFAQGNYIVKMHTKAGVATKKLVVE